MDLKEPAIDGALSMTSIAQNLVKLYYHYPWHNILHNSLTKLLKSVILNNEHPRFEAEVAGPLPSS
jgi:hypothetical protein